jgi:hypothetical protein
MKGQLRSRDQRALELQVETEQLQEQAARQNAVIASLKKRIQVYCYHICNDPYMCHVKISTNLNDYPVSCDNDTTFNTSNSEAYHWTLYFSSPAFSFRTCFSVFQFDIIPQPVSQSSW